MVAMLRCAGQNRDTWTQGLECPSVYLDTLHFLRFAFLVAAVVVVVFVGFLAKCALFLCEATHTHTLRHTDNATLANEMQTLL